jgi:ABC-type uncharacterized transport system ATPase subunit
LRLTPDEARAAFLAVRGLRKSFGGVQVLAGLDLDVPEGSIRCLIGPNGCGKTTLFRVVSGEIEPDAGEVIFAGRPIAGLRPWRIARLGIARKFQTPGVWPELTVEENLAVPLFARAGRFGLLGLLERRRPADVVELLALTGLTRHRAELAGALAHGLKQWLEIAMLLATRPRLLLLDEPTAGMTPHETLRTARLIRRVCDEAGVAAVVIEHDLAFVRALDAPVAVMMKGRILRQGSYEEVRADPMVRELYLGRRA